MTAHPPRLGRPETNIGDGNPDGARSPLRGSTSVSHPADAPASQRDASFAGLPRCLSFTADIEPSPTDRTGRRHLAATSALLDLLDEAGARGTFFVLGEVADAAPWLVRDIAARGHELASHNQTHRALAAIGPATLREEAGRSRTVLQDLSGQMVAGFRAPYFSLTPDTEWAAEVLRGAGYAYSSSVLPARCFLYNHPSAPARPFAWPCGLLELPVPVAAIGPLRLPALGGMYLRYLPHWDLRRMMARLEGPLAWTYCHPYDIDAAEPFHTNRELGLMSSFFLWANRGVTARRLRAMLQGRVSVPLGERLDEAWEMTDAVPELEAVSRGTARRLLAIAVGG
ncbi:polysaccharide deacetylase family protein [Pararoseomonas indoligenes]|uniref:Chitooligosaccharide deacetylase n=1 Tax=Roseomonas indoligenes TaxID=2820811 RepID=A0A940N490_9PROT|nr:polysaccharide deacetylase family protein [Pararoseomonas indoligenes]MBP0493927.1 polysaccharide deacetylase family protein [Pararoseomonas indoligenes]